MIPFCGCNDCVAGRLEQASDSVPRTGSDDFSLTGERWPVDPRLGSQSSTVTWSMAVANYAADYIQFDGFITDVRFISVIRTAFEAWEKVANIDFVEVSDSSDVDVRLGWGDLGGRGGTIGSAYWSYSGDTITQSFIEFDIAENWTYNIGPAGSGVGAYQVALHEIGHIMGIAHSSVYPTIMYPSLVNALAGLTQDDIDAARAIYGAPSTGSPGDPGDPDSIFGTSGNDALVGTQGNDRIYALAGDDLIDFSGGSDRIDGGGGHDTVVYREARAGLTVDWRTDGRIVVSKPDGGTDTLIDVERVDLIGGDYIYDVDSPNLGFGYRIYQAAFGRTPDEGGLRFWVGELDMYDRIGWSEDSKLKHVATAFYNSEEFRLIYGNNVGDGDYIEAMYANVLRRPSDSEGHDYWVDRLQTDLGREDILIMFTQSDENVQNNIGIYDEGIWVV